MRHTLSTGKLLSNMLHRTQGGGEDRLVSQIRHKRQISTTVHSQRARWRPFTPAARAKGIDGHGILQTRRPG